MQKRLHCHLPQTKGGNIRSKLWQIPSTKEVISLSQAEGTNGYLWCSLAYQTSCWPPGSLSIIMLYISESVALLIQLLTLNFSSSDASLPSASHSLITAIFTSPLLVIFLFLSHSTPLSILMTKSRLLAMFSLPTVFSLLLWIHPDACLHSPSYLQKNSLSVMLWMVMLSVYTLCRTSHTYAFTDFFFNF